MSNPISNLNKLDLLRPQDLNCNIFSVYDYDGCTIQELLCQFFEKINECVDISNATFKLAEWLVSVGLEQEVARVLNEWYVNGKLEDIIGVTLDNIKGRVEVVEKRMDYLETKVCYINPKMSIDDINIKLSQPFETFIFENGEYHVTKEKFIKISKSNSIIKFNSGALIIQDDNLEGTYIMLEVRNVDNIEIYSPNIDGKMPFDTPPDELTGGSGPGQWGYGIEITCCSNVKIYNPNIKYTTGDGIYIGYKWVEPLPKKNKNIEIINAKTYRVSRNGISVCSGDNIRIINPELVETFRCSPKAGIDIEPENSDSNRYHLDNLYIESPNTIKNDIGISVGCVLNNDCNIEIKNHTSVEETSSLATFRWVVPNGQFNYNGLTCIRPKVWVMNFGRLKPSKGYLISDINVKGKLLPPDKQNPDAHSMFIFDETTDTTELGKVIISNVNYECFDNKFVNSCRINNGDWNNLIFSNFKGQVPPFKNSVETDGKFKIIESKLCDLSASPGITLDRNYIANYLIPDIPLELPTKRDFMSSLPDGEYIIGHCGMVGGHNFTIAFSEDLSIKAREGVIDGHVINDNSSYCYYKIIKVGKNITIIKE